MDIAFVTNVVHPFVTGGAQKRVHEVGSRLAARGHDVTVYGRHFWQGPRVRELEGMTLRAVSDERDLYVGDRRSIYEAVEFAVDLYAPLRQRAAEHDVVVASVFPYFPVFTSALATRLGGPPLVTTWHEVWDEYWREYLGALGPIGQFVERASSTVPQHPVAVSEQTAAALVELGLSRNRIEVVPNGIDVEGIRSIDPAVDGFDVLFAGRLTAAKNVDVLIRAFDRIASETDETLGIIGDGPESDRLAELIGSLDLGDQVTMLGFLDAHEDVLSHMAAARVFATASTREGFGIAVLEAMAADCTVVVADHPRSAADDVAGGAGFAVEPVPSTMARAIAKALDGTGTTRDPIGVARDYDWDRIVDRAEQVYAGVAAGQEPEVVSPG